MIIKDISFNQEHELFFYSKELDEKIRLVIVDDLYASEEKLTDEYKNKIINFINNLEVWYPIAFNVIKIRANDLYKIDINKESIELTSIFILFEQNEDECYGLSFRTDFDIEHGCGLQILGENFKITEIGTAEVAFSI